jgi:hypothetical protein
MLILGYYDVAMDAKALMAIRNNILSRPTEAIQGKTIAIAMDAWNALQITYDSKGGMLVYYALSDITRLQCENAARINDYINTFRKLLLQLSGLKAPLSDIHAVILFGLVRRRFMQPGRIAIVRIQSIRLMKRIQPPKLLWTA